MHYLVLLQLAPLCVCTCVQCMGVYMGVSVCVLGLVAPVLAKQAGAQLEEIAEETELTAKVKQPMYIHCRVHVCHVHILSTLSCMAKVLHVEDSGEDFPYHFVQLFDARGRDLAEILRQQMDESQSMDAQLTTEATPPLPTEVDGCALGCFIAVCHRLILSLGCLT